MQVPDGATVALVPRNTKHHLHDSHDYMPGESEPQFFVDCAQIHHLYMNKK